MPFTLDPILAKDGILVGETADYVVNLANDSRYPWLVVIPKVEGITEIHDLDEETQLKLSKTSSTLAREMMEVFNGDKFNIAALGNMVSQLHIHHIVRQKTDDAWPKPVWGFGDSVPYGEKALTTRIGLLRCSLSILANQ